MSNSDIYRISASFAAQAPLERGKTPGCLEFYRTSIFIAPSPSAPPTGGEGKNNAKKSIFTPLSTDLMSRNLIPTIFTVMLLGMGNDGHFASLFPEMLVQAKNSPKNNLEFEVSAEPSIITTPALGNPKLPRISMNLSLILKSKRIILLANGKEKQAVLKSAEKDKMLPIYHLLKQTQVPIEIESL